MTSPLPPAARLAWWGTAWLRGQVVADLFLDAVIDQDATHAVAGLGSLDLGSASASAPVAGSGLDPDADGGRDLGTETLLGGFARLRALGAVGCGGAFPVEGDPIGLGGPPDFNRAALEAGEAVVAMLADGTAVGLVPVRVGAAVTWVAHRAARRQLPDVGEADRSLRGGLVQSANALAALDVARWRPEVADRLMDLRHREPVAAPPGVPARCVDLLVRGLQALEIVDLALGDDGGALGLHEITQREAAIRPLASAGRRALVAACSPEVWPPEE